MQHKSPPGLRANTPLLFCSLWFCRLFSTGWSPEFELTLWSLEKCYQQIVVLHLLVNWVYSRLQMKDSQVLKKLWSFEIAIARTEWMSSVWLSCKRNPSSRRMEDSAGDFSLKLNVPWEIILVCVGGGPSRKVHFLLFDFYGLFWWLRLFPSFHRGQISEIYF